MGAEAIEQVYRVVNFFLTLGGKLINEGVDRLVAVLISVVDRLQKLYSSLYLLSFPDGLFTSYYPRARSRTCIKPYVHRVESDHEGDLSVRAHLTKSPEEYRKRDGYRQHAADASHAARGRARIRALKLPSYRDLDDMFPPTGRGWLNIHGKAGLDRFVQILQ